MAAGDWLLVEELFERADATFVDSLRRIDDANALGAFAARWYADRRPEARRFLSEYLDRPLNAYRHEALVKRFFKLAEAAGDDGLMGQFVVAFDRSVRRVVANRRHQERAEVNSDAEATALAAAWRNAGHANVYSWRGFGRKYNVWGTWTEQVIRQRTSTTMPRGVLKPAHAFGWWDVLAKSYRTFNVPDWVIRLRLDARQFRDGAMIPESRRKDFERWRLFSVATRNYLRRRAWRYFRKLGRVQPERYVPAVKDLLVRYRDEDVADGLALIDNWGLVHALFHFSPALIADDRGWRLAEGRALSDLEPAPQYERLWAAAPRSLVELLGEARCRPVRNWTVQMIRNHLAAVLPVFPLEERLGFLGHDDAEVAALAADLLRDDPRLADVQVDRWLALVDGASVDSIDTLCALIERWVPAERVSLTQALWAARQRPFALAQLGLRWLQARTLNDDADRSAVLGLVDAECDRMRPEIVRWARQALASGGPAQPEWIVDWLDSRYQDVRAEGWQWFLAEPAVRDDVNVWRRLMETPYDDVRLALVAELETRSRSGRSVERGDLDQELMRLLWASVLLNVFRGNRAKPLVVRQLVRRIEARPAERPDLLPLLAIALRSVRGPEWRAGLSAVVRLAERDAESASAIRDAFPELQLA